MHVRFDSKRHPDIVKESSEAFVAGVVNSTQFDHVLITESDDLLAGLSRQGKIGRSPVAPATLNFQVASYRNAPNPYPLQRHTSASRPVLPTTSVFPRRHRPRRSGVSLSLGRRRRSRLVKNGLLIVLLALAACSPSTAAPQPPKNAAELLQDDTFWTLAFGDAFGDGGSSLSASLAATTRLSMSGLRRGVTPQPRHNASPPPANLQRHRRRRDSVRFSA